MKSTSVSMGGLQEDDDVGEDEVARHRHQLKIAIRVLTPSRLSLQICSKPFLTSLFKHGIWTVFMLFPSPNSMLGIVAPHLLASFLPKSCVHLLANLSKNCP